MNPSNSNSVASEYSLREFLASPSQWSSTAIVADVHIEIDSAQRFGEYTLITDLMIMDDQGQRIVFNTYEYCIDHTEDSQKQFFENVDAHIETFERLHTRIGEYLDAVKAGRAKIENLLND